jgi:CDP-diacylglycerol---glycerol-3-phosphate 3-phosphatidyltransferase
MDYSRSLLYVKGGSDQNDIEQPQAQEVYPVAFQEPLQPEAVTEFVTESIPAVGSSSVAVEVRQTANLGPNAPAPGLLRSTFPSFPWHRVPNYLTYARCLAIPALMYIFYQPNMNVVAGILFAIASFTDWLDGYLARRWDITSPFGAFLDPVADKLMVSTSLILLAGRYGAKVAIPAGIILAREIAVSALREWMAQRGQRDAVKVGYQGKVKTALTMFALTVLLFVPYPPAESGFLSKLLTPGLVMLYLCSVVTITSGSVYFIAAAPLLKSDSP